MAAQVLACSGAALLGARVLAARKAVETPAATRGKWCHAEAAIALVRDHGAVYQGREPLAHPAGYNPTGFDRWMVRYFLRAVFEMTSSDMAMEVEAEFQHAFDRFDLSGHIDTFAITGDATEAVGFDQKTGSEHVDEAGDNAQVLVYIVLLFLAYPTLRKITFYIVQPQNNPEEGFERMTEIVVEGEDRLRAAVAYLESELNSVCDHPYELNSDGWKQCRYCPAALVCPALQGDIEAMKLKLTPEQFAAIKVSPDNDALARLEITAKKLGPIFEEAHELLKERLNAGPVTIDGNRFYLEDRPGKRKITDNAKATEILGILPYASFHGTYDFAPSRIEAELAAHFKLPKESIKGPSGKSKYRELLGDITEQKINKVLKVA